MKQKLYLRTLLIKQCVKKNTIIHNYERHKQQKIPTQK